MFYYGDIQNHQKGLQIAGTLRIGKLKAVVQIGFSPGTHHFQQEAGMWPASYWDF